LHSRGGAVLRWALGLDTRAPRTPVVVEISNKRETEIGHHDADLMESTGFETNQEVRMARSVFGQRDRKNLERRGIATRAYTTRKSALSSNIGPVSTDNISRRPGACSRLNAGDVVLRPLLLANLACVIRRALCVCGNHQNARSRAVQSVWESRLRPVELQSRTLENAVTRARIFCRRKCIDAPLPRRTLTRRIGRG
jgi:hypothetical protein